MDGGIHSIGDHYMVLMGLSSWDIGFRVIRIMSQWRIDAIVRYILLPKASDDYWLIYSYIDRSSWFGKYDLM